MTHRKKGHKIDSKLATQKTVDNPLEQEEQTIADELICPICKKKLFSKKGVKIHIGKMHPEKGHQIDSKLATQKTVDNPLEQEEQTIADDLICPICKKNLFSKKGVKIHIGKMHPEKGHQIDSKMATLKDVDNLHEQEEQTDCDNWICTICEKTFSSRTERNIHNGKMHPENGHQIDSKIATLKDEDNSYKHEEQNVDNDKKKQTKMKNSFQTDKITTETLFSCYLKNPERCPGKPRQTIPRLERMVKLKKEDIQTSSRVVGKFIRSFENGLPKKAMPFKIMNSGSYYDLTKILDTDEYDFMFCFSFETTPVFDGPPGYCRIKVKNGSNVPAEIVTNDGFVHPGKFKRYVFDMFSKQIERGDFREGRRLERVERDEDSPAFTVIYKAISEKPIDIDLVPCLTLKGWPFPPKKLNWLAKSDSITGTFDEYHAVANTFSGGDPKPELLWRISFSKAEKVLMKNANDGNPESSRKFVVKVLKFIVNQAKKSGKIKKFCSYHLKMFMFEQFGKWNQGEDGKYWKKRMLLETLNNLEAQLKQTPAVIWNYFLPEDNVIRHVPQPELSLVREELTKIFFDIVEISDKDFILSKYDSG